MVLFKHPFKVGFNFGLTSGIITTLGLMVGLNSGTHSKLAVIGGIITLAIADSFSDALGIHFSEESELKHADKEIWQATISTFLSKFLFTAIFAIPVLLLELQIAILVSLAFGLLILTGLCFKIAKEEKKSFWKVTAGHLLITLMVIFLINYVGEWISKTFR